MNTKTYALMLEKKLTEEFKEKFCEKLGYYPIVVTRRNNTDEQGNNLPLLSLQELEECFVPYLPEKIGRQLSLKTKRRYRELVELRNMFCLIARTMGYKLRQIGNYLGKRDHTTVIHNIKTCKDLLEHNVNFQEVYKKIIKTIKNNYGSSTMDISNQVQHQPEPAVFS